MLEGIAQIESGVTHHLEMSDLCKFWRVNTPQRRNICRSNHGVSKANSRKAGNLPKEQTDDWPVFPLLFSSMRIDALDRLTGKRCIFSLFPFRVIGADNCSNHVIRGFV